MPDDQQISVGLKKEQKIGFVLLLIFALLAIGLGVLQIRNTMYAPFALSNSFPGDLKGSANSSDALRFRDTDGDGLTDYDEVMVYHTSPYLADTNSDGISDSESLSRGIDPNCMPGQSCFGDISASSTIIPSVASSSTVNILSTAEDPGPSPEDLANIITDPVQLRQLLLQNGMDKATLDTLSDAELSQLAAETFINNSTTLQSLSNLSTFATSTSN